MTGRGAGGCAGAVVASTFGSSLPPNKAPDTAPTARCAIALPVPKAIPWTIVEPIPLAIPPDGAIGGWAGGGAWYVAGGGA